MKIKILLINNNSKIIKYVMMIFIYKERNKYKIIKEGEKIK